MPQTSTLHRLEGRRFINSREEVGFYQLVRGKGRFIPTCYRSGIQVIICYYSVLHMIGRNSYNPYTYMYTYMYMYMPVVIATAQ